VRPILTTEDHALLLDLLALPTAGPLEGGSTVRLWDAQRRFAAAATDIGFEVVRHGVPSMAEVDLPDTPLLVRDALARPEFLDCQPSLVLRLGPELPMSRTVMCNVHLDTVAGLGPVGFDGRRFTGRGAIDAKGPAVALLAGIRAAASDIDDRISVLVQAVSGEEGGALGTIGTRPLVARGFVGRLNVFCEPTGLRYLPRATAAMTACVRVCGDDAIDDRPAAGHNATVLLGFLAQHLACRVDGVCIAGLHTGHLHNKVYGSGTLLLNMGYADQETAARLESALVTALREGIDAFAERFGDRPDFARTARDAPAITSLVWQKRGLPTLTGIDAWGEALLTGAGVPGWPADEPAFTCDAIWLSGVPDTTTVVFGPGSLDTNNAHADGEYAELSELDAFAAGIADILRCFADRAGSES
jgi:acetylornithine deacetylase/succinyl-diaminopimelate desuccinylase-like protein